MRAQAEALLGWYACHAHERNLPWRRAAEPKERVALVEGLLAQTRAVVVAKQYGSVFRDVYTVESWLDLQQEERVERVSPLGLPVLKEAAVTSIAEAVRDHKSGVPGAMSAGSLRLRCGVGPYTASMVALLYKGEGVPVDANVERVGQRVDGDPERWIAGVVAAACGMRSTLGRFPGYEAVCAVLDVGARLCRTRAPECPQCPLRAACSAAPELERQQVLPIAVVAEQARYVVATFQFGGLHHWATQPDRAQRGYLRSIHRHQFHVEVAVTVSGADRDVEILDLKARGLRAVREAYKPAEGSDGDLYLGDSSCEMIADVVLDAVSQEFGNAAWCRVLEDGENGAATYWRSPSGWRAT